MAKATYEELMQEAQKLMKQAEDARSEQRQKVIRDIREMMKAHGLSVEELGGNGRRPSRSKNAPKYKGPNGELWSGGPGRRPDWVREVLAKNGDIEQYRI